MADSHKLKPTYTTTIITRYKNPNDVVIDMNVPVCIVMAVLYPDVPLKIKIKSSFIKLAWLSV